MSLAGIRQLLSQLSIRKKLIFINLLVTTVALFVAVVMAIYGEYENRRDSIIESLLVQAKMVSNNTTAALIFDDPKGAADVLQAFSESEDIQSAIIFDEKGEALARYIKQGAKVNSTTGNGSNAYDNAINTRQLTEKMDFILDKNINIIHDIDFEGKTIGKLLMQADISYLYADIIDYLIFTSLMALIGLTLASVLLLKLSQSITRPLQQLTRLMESVTQNNDYSIRIDNISSDEIGVLTRGFNKMLSHIQVNDEKLAHELTERYKAEKHLDKLAYYDVITGIPNRHSFQQKLEQAIEAALKTNKLMALLFLDLDNFKTVNDTLGHKTGDLLLKQASSRLSNVVRQSDYICRIGGDEFAIIIEHINDIEDVSTVTKKCIECLSNPFVFDGKNFFIGVSIGLSVCPDDAVTANDLLVNADMAMYEAKLNGKNNYQYFNKEMNVVHNNKYQLESDLRHAIELGQLELYYQPQVDMRSGELSGVEALMRWNHPERGMVAPDEFIPVAEETGLILQLGEWLLHTACHHAKKIEDSALKGISVALNISGMQIHEEDFIDTVWSALKESKATRNYLEFEITESILMDNSELVSRNINQLNSLGMHLAIDDFGTGFSSMGYLKSFPISKLKIDKSFISGLPHSDKDTAITQAVIAMSHSLNIKVVAEGVEHDSQVDLLREFNCDLLQGYYYAKPMPFDDLFKLVNSSKIKINNAHMHMIKGGADK